MSDITSGYNIAKNIYIDPEFNDMCGFRDTETENAVKAAAASFGLKGAAATEPLDMMRSYCNENKIGIACDPTKRLTRYN